MRTAKYSQQDAGDPLPTVIRLSVRRRLVNLLTVAQRTNAFHKWRRRQDHGSLVVSSNLTSTMKTLFEEK